MILVVDDEPVFLKLAEAALQRDGYTVTTFDDPEAALASLDGDDEPELILSDIVMPEMDGFAFREAFLKKHPDWQTPFVFLSSLKEPEHLVRGFDADVDDYIVKPIDPRVLRAKVRSLLRRSRRPEMGRFEGNLSRTPFIKVVQFCEHQGLSGNVTFKDDSWVVKIPFKAGSIVLDEVEDGDAVLEKLLALESGFFTISAGSVDFSDLGATEVPPEKGREENQGLRQVQTRGAISSIKIHNRLFEVQTEITDGPTAEVFSVVILDGATVFKRLEQIAPNADPAAIEFLIQEQHSAVEAVVRERPQDFIDDGISNSGPERLMFDELFEAGFEAHRRGDFQAALQNWEKAHELKPGDETLEINLRVVRAKLDQS